jgi:hypothetical protein
MWDDWKVLAFAIASVCVTSVVINQLDERASMGDGAFVARCRRLSGVAIFSQSDHFCAESKVLHDVQNDALLAVP